MPRVSSPANPRFKETVRLIESSRERRKTGRCVLEGEHLVAVYCDRIGAPETLLVVEEALDDPRIATLIERVPDHDVLVVSQRMFANIASLPADIGVLAVVQTPAPTLPAITRKNLHFHTALPERGNYVGPEARWVIILGIQRQPPDRAGAPAGPS